VGRVAFVFPGQNSQYVGMGRDLWEAEPTARRVLEQADEILGLSLTQLMFEGPEEALTATQNQQPAIVAHSAACLAVLEERGVRAEIVAGHSLGEYSALMAAGVLPGKTTLELVRRRGELMAAAGGGAMAAVLGLELAAVERVCGEAGKVGIVGVANHNCPGQVVITGEAEAVEAAGALAREAGAKRVIPLRVTGAFHSPLMECAGQELRKVLDGVTFRDAAIPLVSNVDAQARTEAAGIREALAQQIVSPVMWEQSVREVVARGVETFIEVGPGAVLSGLIRRIVPEAETHCAGTAEQFARLAP
jgi:[acyl-carrier-protein] S-malonyltransferase